MPVQTSTTAFAASRRPGQRGFTLIELMIVVAVVAILAAIAYPSYMESVRKSKRSEAKAVLVELAQRAERFHTVNNTYAGFYDALETAKDPLLTTARDYVISDSEVTDATVAFNFLATPDPATAQKVDKCGALGIDQAGRRTVSGSGATVKDCW